MLKLSDLAGQPDFQLGPLEISPPRRLIEGPGGKANVEPLIMQALLILIDSKDNVVTRKILFDQCWGAAAVGDDSLNRAVAKIRQTLEQVAPGAVEIETIPRTGYRLTLVDPTGTNVSVEPVEVGNPASSSNRRTLMLGGLAIAAASGGLYFFARDRTDPRFEAMMAAGREAIHDGSAFEWNGPIADRSDKTVKLYEKAVAIEPGNAEAWGLLAYFRAVAAQSRTVNRPVVIERSLDAIRRAQAIDAAEPSARVAKILLEGAALDLAHYDAQLREILTAFPNNLPVKLELMPFLQAAGYGRESYEVNEQILAVSPIARQYLIAKALKLWIMGKVREADRVIDRVRGIWPDNQFAFGVRMLIFGLTGRPQAALAMIDSDFGREEMLKSSKVWKPSMTALADGRPQSLAVARNALLEAARGEPAGVNDIIMLLGALGLVEEAFEVTEGYILWRGEVVSKDQSDGRALSTYNRRGTQWLFTPPLAKMRTDPRFPRLCDDFGLSAYWRARGVQPDYLRYA